MCFVDQERAFDKVQRRKEVGNEKKGIPKTLINLSKGEKTKMKGGMHLLKTEVNVGAKMDQLYLHGCLLL